ncbi:MAG: hypothetical protein M1162_01445 [Candidatus Thermoplasmatota archaeon]|jgi:hypothetical protein|nr:hypothetical protein [Candidatus Thermoplasmatota archaeon]
MDKDDHGESRGNRELREKLEQKWRIEEVPVRDPRMDRHPVAAVLSVAVPIAIILTLSLMMDLGMVLIYAGIIFFVSFGLLFLFYKYFAGTDILEILLLNLRRSGWVREKKKKRFR